MWRVIVTCWLLGGCGFRSSAGPGDGRAVDAIDVVDAADPSDAAVPDAPAGDAAADAPGDAPKPPASTCWQHWLAHDLALDTPVELTQLSTGGAERDPWISKDGRRLYFAREPGTKGMSDIYLSTRAATTDPFVDAAEVTNLNTGNQESRASLTEDELTLVLASNRSQGHFQIYAITRPGADVPFGSPNQDRLSLVDADPASLDRFDPFITADGRKLYLAPDPAGPDAQHISFSTFDSDANQFTAPVPVPVINTANGADADPALSLDERVIVFSSKRSGGVGLFDLYYATRADPGQSFGAPIPIPTVNGAVDDSDPTLSADGCELYFASTRSGSDLDLFVARVTP